MRIELCCDKGQNKIGAAAAGSEGSEEASSPCGIFLFWRCWLYSGIRRKPNEAMQCENVEISTSRGRRKICDPSLLSYANNSKSRDYCKRCVNTYRMKRTPEPLVIAARSVGLSRKQKLALDGDCR